MAWYRGCLIGLHVTIYFFFCHMMTDEVLYYIFLDVLVVNVINNFCYYAELQEYVVLESLPVSTTVGFPLTLTG